MLECLKNRKLGMEVGTFPESSMDPFCSQQLWDPFPQDSRLPRSVNKLSRSVEPACVTDLVMDFFTKHVETSGVTHL